MGREDNASGIMDEYEEEIERMKEDVAEHHDHRAVRVIESLADHPEGLLQNELRDRLEDHMAPNTLRTRLDQLQESNVISQDPRQEDWDWGDPKRYTLNNVEKWNKIFGEWDSHTDVVLSQWEKALDEYEPGNERRLVELYSEYVEMLQGDPYPGMYEPTPDDAPTDIYEHILIELYRFHTEKIFGETYIQTSDTEEEYRLVLFDVTRYRAVSLRDQMYRIWSESSVPGPE